MTPVVGGGEFFRTYDSIDGPGLRTLHGNAIISPDNCVCEILQLIIMLNLSVREGGKPIKISTIMPVLNEALHLRRYLGQLLLTESEELIVVDGGSTDNTMSIAREFTDKVFQTETGRASVMNYGAGKATGDILLFVHADCALSVTAFSAIRHAMGDEKVAAGAFYLSIDHGGFSFRLIESVANLRSRITRLLYGDQGMFVRKDLFQRIGGFTNVPLMEDIEISKRLKKEGRIVFIRPAIKASPRRWLNEGILYTTVRDWTIAFCYTFLKVPPEKLIRHYREIR